MKNLFLIFFCFFVSLNSVAQQGDTIVEFPETIWLEGNKTISLDSPTLLESYSEGFMMNYAIIHVPEEIKIFSPNAVLSSYFYLLIRAGNGNLYKVLFPAGTALRVSGKKIEFFSKKDNSIRFWEKGSGLFPTKEAREKSRQKRKNKKLQKTEQKK